MWHGGKGSKSRIVNLSSYGDEYDRIFGKKDEEETDTGKRRLLLDDIRYPSQCSLVYSSHVEKLVDKTKTVNSNWHVVRSIEEFTEWIMQYGSPDIVSFDNDLKVSHYERYVEVAGGRDCYNYEKETDTGIAALRFMLNYCKEHHLKLPKIYVHTANKYARDIMNAKLKELGL